MSKLSGRILFCLLLSVFILFYSVHPAFSSGDQVKLAAPLTDLAGVFKEGPPESLIEMITELEADNGPKVKVLIIRSSGTDTLDIFAEKILSSQPQKLRPDALLVISTEPRAARIAVSEKSQPLLHGVAVRTILRESVNSFLKEGHYYSAIEHGVRQMEDALRGKGNFGAALPAPGSVPQTSKTGGDGLVNIPPYSPVADTTGTLAHQDVENLKAEIAALEQRKGSQIAVLMLPSVKPETIEQFALRAFEAWKPGRKGVDDGILIVVAKNDRQMRIEVGYGLEGTVTDLIAGRILDEQMRPMFRKNDYGGGLSVAVQQLIRLIEGESLPAPSEPSSYDFSGQAPDPWVFLAALALVITGVILSRWVPVFVTSPAAGLGAGALFWFTSFFGFAIFFGLVAAAFTFMLSRFVSGIGSISSWSGSSFNSTGRDSDSDSGSSSGSDSDSDSGGGGSSGGGGASSDW